MNQLLRVQPHILDALHDRQPVVALESSIIAHGMPYPANIELVKSNAVLAAKIAVEQRK